MQKKIATLTLSLLLLGSTAFASPVEFEKGSLEFEVGATLNAKSSGSGRIPNIETDGKSGYKIVVTHGLSDKFALQLKHGKFTSVDSSYGPLTTYVESVPTDLNLLYKVNDNLTLLAGYEHTEITYGKYVADAGKSALHLGFTAQHPLSERTTLFTTQVFGKDAALHEYGISYKASKVTTLNVSYADRRVNNVQLTVPVLGIDGREDYALTGYTCTVGFKF